MLSLHDLPLLPYSWTAITQRRTEGFCALSSIRMWSSWGSGSRLSGRAIDRTSLVAIRGVECRRRRWVLQTFVYRTGKIYNSVTVIYLGTGQVFVTSNNLLHPVRTFSLDLHTASTEYCIVEDSRINNRSHLVQPNIRYKLALADSSQIAA